MHITDRNLKVLIDVLAERLDDDQDMLSDSNFMEEREAVKMAWAVKDLLENLRQEQRSRAGRATHQFAGISNAPSPDVQPFDYSRFDRLESLVAEHEAERMAHRSRLEVHTGTHDAHNDTLETYGRWLNVLDATIGDLKAALDDHREQLQALELQGNDRWVRTQQLFRRGQERMTSIVEELQAHVGEGEVRH